MDCYETWFDLAPGTHDGEFIENLEAYLLALKNTGSMASYRIRRRKLGFGPSELGEFNVTMEFASLHQLEEVFGQVAKRAAPMEELHAKVFRSVINFRTGLYRDFPSNERD